MKRITLLLVGVGTLAGIVVFTTTTSRDVSGQGAAPIFVIKIPDGYRDWIFISVAHEAGELNDIRTILGNDPAIKAYREATLPFPEGTIIARIAWRYVPSEENNKIFGREQSFVPGEQPPARRGRGHPASSEGRRPCFRLRPHGAPRAAGRGGRHR